ncbi:MAG: sigma-70 family RNA polymerase sigma factor [Chloroflexota bacterium]|nr:sigma-70 family RNA polymerase sigma factor [Chloroflexota bacterium]
MRGRPLDDVQLVERAQQGDVSAYEELVRRYQNPAFWAAYAMTRDSDAASDVAQTGFIKAYYALNRFRAGAAFRPWLLKIVTNEARNQTRSARRRSGYEVQLAGNRTGDAAAPSPEAQAVLALDREVLLNAVNRLPEQDQQALAYRYFLDLSEAEMAAALGCARGTVKSRLSRARARLRASLASEHPDLMDREAHGE